MELFYKIGSIFHASEERADNGSVYFTPKESLAGRSQKGRLSKLDISSPTNFKHVTHVGLKPLPGFDPGLDLDQLFTMAGVKEQHLEDKELSHKIFSVLEKAGSLENVRKQTRRMTTVDRPSARSRLRSLSSSSITPSKRQNGQPDSPHAAKILAHGSTLCRLPSLSKVPPPMETPPPFSHFQSIRSLPPYLDELSHSFSPAANFPFRHYSKKTSSPPHPPSSEGSTSLPPGAHGVTSESSRPPVHPCTGSNVAYPSSLPHVTPSQDKMSRMPDPFPPSIPGPEPPMKLGDAPLPPELDGLNAGPISVTVPPSIPGPEPPMKLGDAPLPPELDGLNAGPISVTVPPPPAPPLVIKHFPENLPCNGSERSVVLQVKGNGHPENVQDANGSHKDPEQQNNPVFLDQIKRGVQLKSVAQLAKAENAESVNIVTALMEVIKRRHKAIHSSDEEEEEDEEWED